MFPEYLEGFVGDDNSVRVIDAYVECVDLGALGSTGVDAKETGRPHMAHLGSSVFGLFWGYCGRFRASRDGRV